MFKNVKENAFVRTQIKDLYTVNNNKSLNCSYFLNTTDDIINKNQPECSLINSK